MCIYIHQRKLLEISIQLSFFPILRPSFLLLLFFFLFVFVLLLAAVFLWYFNVFHTLMHQFLTLFFLVLVLVLWSICLSSTVVHFKNCPKYHIRETTQAFNPLMRFLLQSLVSRSFLLLWGTFFLFFSFQVVRCFPLPIFLSTCNFPFLQAFWFFPDLAVLFLPLFLFVPLFILSKAHFSMLNSILPSCQYVLIFCIKVYTSFIFHFCTYFDVIHVHKVINLFLCNPLDWRCRID